jgi:hypothetical protein
MREKNAGGKRNYEGIIEVKAVHPAPVTTI